MKTLRKTFYFADPVVIDWFNSLPRGQASRVVETAIKEYLVQREKFPHRPISVNINDTPIHTENGENEIISNIVRRVIQELNRQPSSMNTQPVHVTETRVEEPVASQPSSPQADVHEEALTPFLSFVKKANF